MVNKLYFCADLNEFFQPKREIDNGRFIKNPEKPKRLSGVFHYLKEHFDEIPVLSFSEEHILKVHTERYYNYVLKKSQEVLDEYIPEVFFVDQIFDTGTPINRYTIEAAKRAVNVVLSATQYAFEKKSVVYALTRPPGHHAMRNYGGGYCYFNNVAVAARYLEEKGMKIAIFDIDFHHGNGTQDIFYDDPNVLYVSIHGDPKEFYPWYSGFETETGKDSAVGTNLNIPLPRNADLKSYLEALNKALEKIRRFRPDALFLSFGTDTHINDPVGKFALLSNDYKTIGSIISDKVSFVDNIVIVHEGGYNSQANLAAVKNFISGFFS